MLRIPSGAALPVASHPLFSVIWHHSTIRKYWTHRDFAFILPFRVNWLPFVPVDCGGGDRQ
jgi:hypothetical protein